MSVERHQVDAGVSSCLLAVAEDRVWPPTLRDMAAGQLQHLLETHRNLVQLGTEHARRRGDAESRKLLGLAAQSGERRPSAAAAAGTGAKFVTAKDKADKARVAAVLASVAAAGSGAGAGAGARAPNEAPVPTGEEAEWAALEGAAGAHPGLVPFMLAMVRLMETGHPLLELRGARGVARTCFSAARGAPSSVALLVQAKATAAAAGAVGALVELLR